MALTIPFQLDKSVTRLASKVSYFFGHDVTLSHFKCPEFVARLAAARPVATCRRAIPKNWPIPQVVRQIFRGVRVKSAMVTHRDLLPAPDAWEYCARERKALLNFIMQLKADCFRSSVLLAIVLGASLIAAMGCSASSGGSSNNKPGLDGIGTGVGGTGSNPAYNVCPNGDCSNVTVTDNCDGGAVISITAKTGERDLLSVNPGCTKVVNWGGQDAAVVEAKPPPPTTESYACPTGTTRVHVRDVWSKLANPTLGQMDARPDAVILTDTSNAWLTYSARQDSVNCDWYSTCMSLATTGQLVMSAQAATCQTPSANSGTFTLSQYASSSDVWIDYTGSSSTISADYSNYPSTLVTGAGHFRITTTQSDVASELCSAGSPPDTTAPAGTIRLHFRYMWGDPAKTGFAGTACEQQNLGITTPPYPTSLEVTISGGADAGAGCNNGTAMLELQNGDCPWYVIDIPTSLWVAGATIKITYPGADASSLSGVALPAPPAATEYWLAYAGPPQNVTTAEAQACMGRYNPATLTYFYTQNPGPGYQGCGGGAVTIDPCNPPVPAGFSPIHFRYLWAGQKTFTYFPQPDFMPTWIVLRVNGNEVICFREANRPWFNCPVNNTYFQTGATWIAADTTRAPTEWNTVDAHPFPSAPGEYWIRWTYGKPDFNDSEAPWETNEKFTIYTYYPDGVGGDLSATGNWGDEACAPKPPSDTSMKLGFGGWFPYDETNYVYPYGASLARTYPAPGIVQQLLNYIVQERYLLWKEHYFETADDPLGLGDQTRVCGADTARVVYRDRQNLTYSEGQGYGMAISAAIGDQPTFDKLWNFVRHYLSQSAKKYCGGLMGYQWNADGSTACRPLDVPCDPDTETTCGGIGDSAFDGDVDIAMGLVYAAMQWPEYRNAAITWLLKMECEIDTVYDGKWNYPTKGDTDNKDCSGYPGSPCKYDPGSNGTVFMDYYPPGYFRVFGDFLEQYLDPTQTTANERAQHRTFFYHTASTVYEMYERCYDQSNVNPALVNDTGTFTTPCAAGNDNYDWARYQWRAGIDAAWFGNRQDFVENATGSSRHYAGKSEMEAKIDLIQDFYANFYQNNPVEPNANRFSSICQYLMPDGNVTNCDPGYGHNSYFVNTAMCPYVSIFDDDGKTTGDIRREALEEAVSTTIENTRVFQESIGVYTLLFLTGNFPNPLMVP